MQAPKPTIFDWALMEKVFTKSVRISSDFKPVSECTTLQNIVGVTGVNPTDFCLWSDGSFVFKNQGDVALLSIVKDGPFNEPHNLLNLDYYGSYDLFFKCFLAAVFLGFVLFFVNFVFADITFVKKSKVSVYECGFDPVRSARMLSLNLIFFKIALLFLIFDLELIYLLPYLTLHNQIYWQYYKLAAFFPIVFFFAFLIAGILYEYLSNSLTFYVPTKIKKVKNQTEAVRGRA